MLTLGFISLNPAGEDRYFTEIAERSLPYGIECFRFMPTKIKPDTHIVSGETYDQHGKQWIHTEFPIPQILYDRCFYGDKVGSKTSHAIVNWLKKREDLVFLGLGLPNKWELYQTLSRSSLSPYIAKTSKVKDAQQVLSYLNNHEKIILKPTIGAGGMGIVYLEKENETISVVVEKQHQLSTTTFPNSHIATSWLKNLLQLKEYLMQPFLFLTNVQKCPFDIRILMQKNGLGNWVERGRGIRVGRQNGILSNLSAGAEAIQFENWLTNLETRDSVFLIEELKEISAHLPDILEKAFPPLFELGIDIGVARDLSLWILDINSKPGHKVLLETNPNTQNSLYSAPLEYGSMLALNHMKERNNYEQTLSD